MQINLQTHNVVGLAHAYRIEGGGGGGGGGFVTVKVTYGDSFDLGCMVKSMN